MASSQSVCHDTNLLIDVLARRPRYNKVFSRFSKVTIYASAYSVGTLYYYAKKYEKISNQEFEEFIKNIKLLAVDASVIEQAFRLASENDLEDAIQIAACKIAKVQNFATADKKISKLYGKELNIEFIA